MANLSEILKSETLTSHKQVEKLVIDQIKKINNEDDYIALLEKFYLFYQGVEELTFPYLQEQQAAAELCEKRSPRILQDFEELQTDKAIAFNELSALPIPQNYPEALVALYVLEGSSMGGPYIAKMLEKRGIQRGLNFFRGDQADFMQHWQQFKNLLNEIPETTDYEHLTDFSNAVFTGFGQILDKNYQLAYSS